MNKKELGIYVHIPFCAQKCLYCDFVSYAGKTEIINEYVNALLEEIKGSSSYVSNNNYNVTTIYIGGGTPSFIDSKYIIEIINYIKKYYNIDVNAEITIEINPGTVVKEKLEDYKECGINRVSIGLQTTDNDLLKKIGRIHTYEQFLATYELARKIGFQNINVDLMLALPTQSLETLQDSLSKVIKLNPEHISIYSLILEEGTPLEKLVQEGKLKLPDEDTERKMYWKTKQMLEQSGYIHYEISNFAKPQKQSKHNLNCWNQEEYLGFGLAAHSYTNQTRYSNTENLQDYINYAININHVGADFISAQSLKTIHETQTKQDQQKEYMLLGLRKIQGIQISKFKQKFTNNPIYLYRKELQDLVNKELLEIDLDTIKLTKKGIDFANLVWEKFV